MGKKSVSIGFTEFIVDSVQDLIQTMPWMKETDMKLCQSIEELNAFIDRIIAKGDGKKKPHCCVDLETTGLSTRSFKGVPCEKIVGVGIALDKNVGIYVPVNHVEGSEYNLSEKDVLQCLRRLFKCAIIIFHNSKYDRQFLKNYGVEIESFEDFEDTLILARLHDTGQKEIGLKYLSEKHLGRNMIELSAITKGTHRFDLVIPTVGYVYGASDSLCTYGLFELYINHPIIIEQMKIYNVEKRIVPIVMEMEANLVLIDKDYLKQEAVRVAERIEVLKKEIHKITNREFNIDSPQQLGKVLFDDLKYEYPEKKKTATGFYITEMSCLEKISNKYPAVKHIITIRKLEKILNTYIANLLANCDEDGCIKLCFNQTGTDTGRFSSPGGRGLNEDGYCGFNVQSMPANYDAEVPDLRRGFIARPGKKILACDFSGEELRVAANLSKEKKWVDEFLYGTADLHTVTGKAIFKKDEISKAERQIGKCVARGTLIASNRGWLPIEELTENDHVISHTGNLEKIEKVWEMGMKPGLEIITRSGHKIICGLNHRFLTLDDIWVRAEDLVPGQIIKTISCENINPKEIQRFNFNFWDKGNNSFISEDLPYVELNPLWGRLLGYIMGDGSIRTNCAGIVCSDEFEDIKEDIINISTRLGLYPRVRKTRRLKQDGTYGRWLYNISVGSRIFVRFLREIGFSGRREWKEEEKFPGRHRSSKIFRIPKCLFKSPKIVSKEFLSSLFETDGTVEQCLTSVTTKDIDFARDIILLLASFGLKAYMREHESKKYNRMYYQVCLNVHASRIFQEKIGFISHKKRTKLYEMTQRGIKRPRPGDFSMKWKTEIKSITPIENVPLMDLTVANNHTYIAQGLITHNTCNFQILYGSGPRGIAEQAHISEMEARKAIDGFLTGLPILAQWIKDERRRTRKNKKAKTPFGRIRPFDQFYDSGDKALEAHADRASVNFSVQGTCADIMKICMIRINNWIKSNNLQDDIKMLITIHDEIVFEVTETKLAEFIPKISNIMALKDVLQGSLNWPVPLTIDAEYGDSWHVDHDFFKEHPELKNTEDKIEFRQAETIMEPKIPEVPVQNDGSSQISLPTNDTPPIQTLNNMGDSTSNSPFLSVNEFEQKSSPEQKSENTDDPLEIFYKIKDRTDLTLYRLNEILMFLNKEKDKEIYKGPMAVLKLQDMDGNSLLVSNIKIRSDSFFTLARFLSI